MSAEKQSRKDSLGTLLTAVAADSPWAALNFGGFCRSPAKVEGKPNN